MPSKTFLLIKKGIHVQHKPDLLWRSSTRFALSHDHFWSPVITNFGPSAKLIMVPKPNRFWFLSETDVDPQDITDYGPWASTAEVPWCGPIHGLNQGGATPSSPQKKNETNK